MDFEKNLVIAAPVDRVWELLLDPKVMAGCVPGTQSVEVLSETEYLAQLQVKISFVSAKFKIKTKILETRPPNYLRSEGSGEEASVGSSLKQSSELFLTDLGNGKTELRMKIKVDVLGRLGTFGLNVMKTKADRMWDEFGANFTAKAVSAETQSSNSCNESAKNLTDAENHQQPSIKAPLKAASVSGEPRPQSSYEAIKLVEPVKGGWWQRTFGSGKKEGLEGMRRSTDIYIEVTSGDKVVRVLWPADAAPDCTAWLKDYLK